MCEYTVASPYLGRWACGAILSIPRLTLESRRWQAAFSSRYQVTVEKQERLSVVHDLQVILKASKDAAKWEFNVGKLSFHHFEAAVLLSVKHRP